MNDRTRDYIGGAMASACLPLTVAGAAMFVATGSGWALAATLSGPWAFAFAIMWTMEDYYDE